MNNEPQANSQVVANFASLGLSEHLCRSLKNAGYARPTPIQAHAIPHALRGRDLLGCAQTGTGKTAAFSLPVLQRIMNAQLQGSPVIQTLVLAPTRELAAQIGASFEKYAGRDGPRSLVIFGGVGKHGQIQGLRGGVDVLVATPGRLIDLMNEGVLNLQHVQTLVLDEADRMLDMGFIRDVRRITRALPGSRQTLLFSATMPREIQELADQILTDPVRVSVDPISSTREPIEQSVYFVEKAKKTSLLLKLLENQEIDRALVFSRTKHGANRLKDKLVRAGVGATVIHGNKSQTARARALADFKSGRVRVVVATDIAARGIDVKDLSYVVNFDLPNEPESYVHRIGRTGRAGRAGVAVSFCSHEERSYLQNIERLTQRRLTTQPTPKGMAPSRARPSNAGAEADQQTRGSSASKKRQRRRRRPPSGGERGSRFQERA